MKHHVFFVVCISTLISVSCQSNRISEDCIPDCNENIAPIVNAGADAAITLPNVSYTLQGTVSDDGLPNTMLHITWSQISDNDTILFSDSNNLVTTITVPNTPGEYQLQLQACDEEPLCTSDIMTLSVYESGTHDFTGLPMTADGWTNFEAMLTDGYSDALVVFVSSSEGNDSTGQVYDTSSITFDSNGMFQPAIAIQPYATITAAYSNMRAGYPDIILLKRGDEWVDEGWRTDSIGRAVAGRSASEPHIIASYGNGERPQLHNNHTLGFDNDDRNFIIVTGIRFYADNWLESRRAIDVRGTSQNILFEDVKVDQHAGGIFQGGDLRNMVVRRCIFTEHEAHDGMFYASSTKRLLFEENTFYKPYDDSYTDEARYGRTMYLNPGDGINLHKLDVTLRGNILYFAERGGIDGRAGGTIDGNLFIGAGVRFGANGGSGGSVVYGSITNNVFTQCTDKLFAGTGLGVFNAVNTIIQGNIFTDPGPQNSEGNAITISGDSSYDTYIARNILIADNIIYGWKGAGSYNRGLWFLKELTYGDLDGTDGETDISNLVIQNNEIQMVTGSTLVASIPTDIIPMATFSGNRYFSSEANDTWFSPGEDFEGWLAATGETNASNIQINYTDPNRTVSSYNASLGGEASLTDFINNVLQQSRHNWHQEYTAEATNSYIHSGFTH